MLSTHASVRGKRNNSTAFMSLHVSEEVLLSPVPAVITLQDFTKSDFTGLNPVCAHCLAERISSDLEKEGIPSSHCCALTYQLDEISSTCWKINEPASLELIEETEVIIKLNFRITRCFIDDMQLVS